MREIEVLERIFPLISGSPMVKISCTFRGRDISIFAKCEWYSLSGSIKDRAAYFILHEALESGALSEGQPIVESTSGNMGISLAAMSRILGHEMTIVMARTMSQERMTLAKMYGAKLILVDNLNDAVDMCARLESEGYFWPKQFENSANSDAHYLVTATEIDQVLGERVKNIAVGVGTSGTLAGLSRYYGSRGVKIVAIEPDSARVLSRCVPGSHQLQGLNGSFVPEIFRGVHVDEILSIKDSDAIRMAQRVCQELGLGVGISSGANILGAILVGDGSVTVLPDDNKKYISTALSSKVSSALVDEIKLTGIEWVGKDKN